MGTDILLPLSLKEALMLQEVIPYSPEYRSVQEQVVAAIEEFEDLASYQDEIARTDR
jgi:hypothetical protein